jgi:hypothetical protein
MPNKNTIEKAQKVQEIVRQHYEPGRQDRCKLWVFRNIVIKTSPMSESTFFRYLSIEREPEQKQTQDDRRLKLF